MPNRLIQRSSALIDARRAEQRAKSVREQIERLKPTTAGTMADALAALDKKLDSINGASAVLSRVMTTLTEADVQPTSLQLDIVARARAEGARVVAQWTAINAVDLPAVNAKLTAAGLAPLAP